MNKVAIVKRLNGGFALYTRDGKRILGKHDSAQDAYKQEYAIQKSKEKSAAPNPDPTPAQIESGNYKKDHLSLQGLRIAIENLKGSRRKGVDRGGSRWSVKMPADYGYIKAHEGKDGDDVDVYIGPNRDGFMVYIINQKDPGTGRFDEHKCMIGFRQKKKAIATYLKGFSDGSGIRRIMGVKSMTMPQFKAWLSVPANLKKQASAKEQLKDFIAQTFGKTARLAKTAGVEIHSLGDVATALKAFMAKQGQADPAYQAMRHISSHPEVTNEAVLRTRNDLAMNQMRDLSGLRGGARPSEFARVSDYMAGKSDKPYISGQELQDSIPSQLSAPAVAPQPTPGPAPVRNMPSGSKPSDYMMGGRLFGQQPGAQVTAQAPQAASTATAQRGRAFTTPASVSAHVAPMAGAVTDPNDLQSKLHIIQRHRAGLAKGVDTSRIDAVYNTYLARMNQLKAKPGTPVPPTVIPPAKPPTQVQPTVKTQTTPNTSPIKPTA